MTENLDRIPSLGLVLDHARHRATREPGVSVELGGRRLLWKLLAALARRYDDYYRKNDLINDVWDEDRLAGNGVADGTLYWAISELRDLLRPLELTIEHTHGLGYRLKDLRTQHS